MKRRVSLLLNFLLLWCAAAINAQNLPNIGFIVMNDSDRVEIFRVALMNEDIVQTCDSAGRWIEFQQSRISRASIKGKEFIGLPVNKIVTNRLHEVIARSTEYMLTSYIDGDGPYLFIFDKQKKFVMKKTKYSNKGTTGKLKMIKKIKPYLGNCKVLMEKLEKNAQLKDGSLLQNTSAIRCE